MKACAQRFCQHGALVCIPSIASRAVCVSGCAVRVCGTSYPARRRPNDAHVLAEPARLERVQAAAVEVNRAGGGLVKPLQQKRDRRFARTPE
eukprot:6479231-Prymnesium_polylepis.1